MPGDGNEAGLRRVLEVPVAAAGAYQPRFARNLPTILPLPLRRGEGRGEGKSDAHTTHALRTSTPHQHCLHSFARVEHRHANVGTEANAQAGPAALSNTQERGAGRNRAGEAKDCQGSFRRFTGTAGSSALEGSLVAPAGRDAII